jgi:hypothetical protein
MSDRNPLDGLDARLIRVNNDPLQRRATGDVLVHTAVVGGPECEGDRRLYLSAGLLRSLLAMAESTPTQRVEVARAGVQVDLYRSSAGHAYEVWTFLGADARPERFQGLG